MLHHTFLLIYRNFRRFKSTFFINLIGLSTGLTCTFLIYLWVNDELLVDQFFNTNKNLYQVRSNYTATENTTTNFETAGILAEALAEEMPEVEYATVATPIYWFGKFTFSVEDKSVKAKGRYAGDHFFNIFAYGRFRGDKDEALRGKKNIVLSESLARELFNTTENVIGKTVLFQQEEEFIVSGIFEDIPFNATDKFDFVLPFENFLDQFPRFSEWDQRGPSTYLVLKENTDVEHFNDKINQLYQSKTSEPNITLFVKRYSDNYLYGKYENGVQAGGRIEYIRLFSIVAGFILVIACINFMNLSTAKASRRIKEVGIKKAIGASRKLLIFQYMGESMVMASFSMLVAIISTNLLLTTFNSITGKDITIIFNSGLILSLIGITVFTGFLAGSYPALYLSGFHPIKVLKGKLTASVGELWARKGLVVFQFVVSIILMVAVWVVYKQVGFIQTKNIGYDKENIICFDMEGTVAENPETFVNKLKELPGIINASSANSRMIGSYGATSGLEWEGKGPDEVVSFELIQVDYDFIETLGIEMVKGRSFSRNHSADSSRLLFNEAAIEAMGLEDPVGKVITMWGKKAEIVGVTRNFHIESLHEKVKPMVIQLRHGYTNYVMARVEAGKEREVIVDLENIYKAFNPGFVLDYKFLDENYQALYEAEKTVADLSQYFAGLAILISCLGLFGLAAFSAERRIKEIGIRKILGSSEMGIVYLLSSDFTKMVLAAIIFALPLSYYLVRTWLEGFAYQIPLKIEYFLGAAILALLIAWVTVSMQAIKAAKVNPAICLKEE